MICNGCDLPENVYKGITTAGWQKQWYQASSGRVNVVRSSLCTAFEYCCRSLCLLVWLNLRKPPIFSVLWCVLRLCCVSLNRQQQKEEEDEQSQELIVLHPCAGTFVSMCWLPPTPCYLPERMVPTTACHALRFGGSSGNTHQGGNRRIAERTMDLSTALYLSFSSQIFGF